MVGIVLVSHSRALALAVKEMVLSMTRPDLPMAVAAGVGADHAELGTDAIEIVGGITTVMRDRGVLVLMDMGSAVLSTEAALEFLDEPLRAKVRCCAAPFVEGALAAGVAAALGSALDEVSREAEAALRQKTEHFQPVARKSEDADAIPPVLATSIALPTQSITVAVRNPHGLHARPAARLVREAAKHSPEIEVRNVTKRRGPASARSLTGLASLEVLQGHEIEITARGPDAGSALQALREAVESGLGERVSTPAHASVAVKKPSTADLDAMPVSDGIAIGPLFSGAASDVRVPRTRTDDPTREKQRLLDAIATAKAALENEAVSLQASLGRAEAEIFQAQALILHDPALLRAAEKLIFEDRENAALAWYHAFRDVAKAYETIEDDYLRQRTKDVEDIGARVLNALGVSRPGLAELPHPGILVVDDLTPAQAVELSRDSVLGVICLGGGRTSHAAILLRARGMPAIANAKSVFERAGIEPSWGETIAAFDGDTGRAWINPEPADLESLRALQRKRAADAAEEARQSKEDAVTADGYHVSVLANLGLTTDAAAALENGADGVGLFRTEFLFLDRDEPPSEDEQFAAFSALRHAMAGRPVVVRTFDIGGDKEAPYLHMPAEANPFLGVRGIRLSLCQRELFRTHLRAILRGGQGGDFRLLFPMISDPPELLESLAIVREAHAELENREKPHAWPVRAGIMIETPSAAVLVDQLAPLVDFFSIGTNDLTQYLLAADRGNSELARFQDALHPAVLRMIHDVTTVAHRHGKPVSICGEAAGDPEAARILLGLGVDELSLVPALVPRIKATIRSICKRDVERLAEQAMARGDAASVRTLARTHLLGEVTTSFS